MYLSSSNIYQPDDSINKTLQIPPLLNFDFNNSKLILSPDNSFVIFYNDSIILNVDLKLKKIKWYQKLPDNEKISDVQISPNNQISFIKHLNTHNEIICLSNNNYMDYNELKIKDNIIAYKLFQIEDSNEINDIILVVNDFYQISIYKDNILQNSSSRNLIRDINNNLIKYNTKILNIEYIPEQKLILFFFDNGLITIYTINNNNHENIYLNEKIIEYESFINLNEDEDDQYTYYNLNIYKNNYLCENNINNSSIKEEMDIDNNISNMNPQYFTTFLIICANQKSFNKKKSTIYFFKIEDSKFISLNDNDNPNIKYNKISFDNKEILNSYIFKYKINNEENDMSDYIFVLFKQLNNLNNNKLIYSTEYSNLFHWFNLDKENNGNDNNFKIFELFEEFPNTHIYINNINLNQKNRKIFTVSYCQLGEKIITIEHNNKNINNQNELLNSDDYNDYISQLNSINFNEEEFKNDINKKYKELYELNLDEQIFKMNNEYDNLNKDDISKINYFILNLIANQSLFKLKNYLLKRNALNSGFIFPIEQICLTCEFLLNCIKNKIKNDNERNNDIEKLLNIIINILKIIQNRNRAYNDKLFGGEKEIMNEQESIINSMIFDSECILLIYKIQNLYYNLLEKIDDENINNINNQFGISYYNIFSLSKNDNDNNIDNEDNDNILEDNAYEKIINNIKNLHLLYLDLFKKEKLENLFKKNGDNPITLNALLYYMKFVLFNHYFYYIYPKILKNAKYINGKNLDKSEYFKKILSEYKNYFEISKNLFNLDKNGGDTNFYNLIKFIQYISNEKLIMNKEINKILPLNQIIYEFMKCLNDNKCYNESLTMGNSLFSYLSTFDEFNNYLLSALELKDYPLAYSFLNNCLLLHYKNVEQEDKIKKFIQTENYYEIKRMYSIFFEYLIRNKAIDVLFKLPLNFIEIYIFKEFCEENEKYKEFLIIYYIIIGNISEAKYYFKKYLNANSDNNSQSKILYANLIKYYETLLNKKIKNEKVDDIIEKLATENKFLLKIDDDEEKRIIDEKNNGINNDEAGFSESLMKSSTTDNKIISGLNYNVDDYDKISTNLINKLSTNYNDNLNSNYLRNDYKKKLIKMNEIKPFVNTKINTIHLANSNSNYNNLISNKIINSK